MSVVCIVALSREAYLLLQNYHVFSELVDDHILAANDIFQFHNPLEVLGEKNLS